MTTYAIRLNEGLTQFKFINSSSKLTSMSGPFNKILHSESECVPLHKESTDLVVFHWGSVVGNSSMTWLVQVCEGPHEMWQGPLYHNKPMLSAHNLTLDCLFLFRIHANENPFLWFGQSFLSNIHFPQKPQPRLLGIVQTWLWSSLPDDLVRRSTLKHHLPVVASGMYFVWSGVLGPFRL